MLVGPKPDHHYRRTDTKQLIAPGNSFDADPCDLDVIRALECGDLVPVESAATAKKAPAKSKRVAKARTEAETPASELAADA